MAELPVILAATNLVAAIPKLAASAVYNGVLEEAIVVKLNLVPDVRTPNYFFLWTMALAMSVTITRDVGSL
ncbi:hypothetical protein GCM10028808_10860 [Spirosoma migulaei]